MAHFGYVSSESDSSSSDDEEVINFVVRLGRIRKIPRLQIRKDHFNYWDDHEFYCRFRLCKQSVMDVLAEINDDIKHPTNWNNALSARDMLLITLRFYATGSFLIVLGDFAAIHKSTAGKIIHRVTRAIANLRGRYITFPSNKEEVQKNQEAFYRIAKFPRVVGSLDCTHVKIRSPGGPNAEIFRNRKNFFSFNVQTIADVKFRILDIVARWPGSVHDSTIFKNSAIGRKFENREMSNCILVGDAGYPVKNYLLTPLAQTNDIGEKLYNESLIRTRNPVERSYGVWKRRFPVLSNGINLDISKVQWVIVATAVLHNWAIDNNENEPPALNEQEQAAFDAVNNVPVELNVDNHNNLERNQLIEYFNSLLD